MLNSIRKTRHTVLAITPTSSHWSMSRRIFITRISRIRRIRRKNLRNLGSLAKAADRPPADVSMMGICDDKVGRAVKPGCWRIVTKVNAR